MIIKKSGLECYLNIRYMKDNYLIILNFNFIELCVDYFIYVGE